MNNHIRLDKEIEGTCIYGNNNFHLQHFIFKALHACIPKFKIFLYPHEGEKSLINCIIPFSIFTLFITHYSFHI